MDRSNIENYTASLAQVKNMHKNGIISINELIIAEEFLAEKYCIKKVSLFRSNDLINSSKRVIYSTAKKEVEGYGKDSIDNRCVTKIE